MERRVEALQVLAVLLIGRCDSDGDGTHSEESASREPERMRGPGRMSKRGMTGMSMERHRYVMRSGLDSTYASMENPLAPTSEDLAEGVRRTAAVVSAEAPES